MEHPLLTVIFHGDFSWDLYWNEKESTMVYQELHGKFMENPLLMVI